MDLTPFLAPLLVLFFIATPFLAVALLNGRTVAFVLIQLQAGFIFFLREDEHFFVPLFVPLVAAVLAALFAPPLCLDLGPVFVPLAAFALSHVFDFLGVRGMIISFNIFPFLAICEVISLLCHFSLTLREVFNSFVLVLPAEIAGALLNQLLQAVVLNSLLVLK